MIVKRADEHIFEKNKAEFVSLQGMFWHTYVIFSCERSLYNVVIVCFCFLMKVVMKQQGCKEFT